MSFPKTIADELSRLGFSPIGTLAFALPASSGLVSWHLNFRALGFAKNQIDGTLRYHHPKAAPFGWYCLRNYAGKRWKDSIPSQPDVLSGGFAVGQVAGWRSNFTFDNHGLSPDEAAKQVASDMQIKVMPFVSGLQTADQLLKLLTNDEEPYPWFRAQGLTRLAEVAILEESLRRPHRSATNLAARFSSMLQDQLDDVALSQYVNSVLAAAHSGS